MNSGRCLGRLLSLSRCSRHLVTGTHRCTGAWKAVRLTNPHDPVSPSPHHVLCRGVFSSTDSIVPCRHYSSTSTPTDKMEVVYVAPLKGAVRAIKVFSLTTAVGSFFGGPILVWMGNPSVPVAARVAMSSVVMLVGLGTTALLHWLVKGYIMRMEYNRSTGDMSVYTLSVISTLKKHSFPISEAGPPSKSTAFSTFQARGKSFFMHTEVFKDKDLLSKLLGAYSVFEDKSTWDTSAKDS